MFSHIVFLFYFLKLNLLILFFEIIVFPHPNALWIARDPQCVPPLSLFFLFFLHFFHFFPTFPFCLFLFPKLLSFFFNFPLFYFFFIKLSLLILLFKYWVVKNFALSFFSFKILWIAMVFFHVVFLFYFIIFQNYICQFFFYIELIENLVL